MSDRWRNWPLGGGRSLVTATGGTVPRTLADRFSDVIYAVDYGATFDGTTDDTAALARFINALLASTNLVGVMPAGTALTSAALPQINVPGITIYGAGPGGSHNVGSAQGTIIKASAVIAGAMMTIAPTSGGSNQRLAGPRLFGVTLDCNSLAATGLSLKSCYGGDFDFTVLNATSIGFDMGVVASLGESRSNQYHRIRYCGRQQEAAAGIGMRLAGDSGANPSFNKFELVDISHEDAVAIRLDNADNNTWEMVRTFCAGAAVNSIELRGGATEPESCRSELFFKVSTDRPVIAKGTGTYTVASKENRILCLDKANSTPNPTVETGAELYWQNDTSPIYPPDWTAWTPTVTSTGGTITTVGALTMRYSRVGKTVFYSGAIAITTNGTGSGKVRFTLPTGLDCLWPGAGTGRETAATGKQLQVFVPGGASYGDIGNYDDSYPGADGRALNISGSYEVA